MGNLPRPGIKLMSSALSSRCLSTVPPGKSCNFVLIRSFGGCNSTRKLAFALQGTVCFLAVWRGGSSLPLCSSLEPERVAGPPLAGHAVPSLSRFHWPMARAASWPGEQCCGEMRVKRSVIKEKTTHSSWKGGWKDKQRSGRK